MDNLMLRRRAILQAPIVRPDTSPRIAEYGKTLGRGNTTINTDANYCYTEWYDINPAPGSAHQLQLVRCGINSNHTYQFTTSTGGANWDYRKEGNYYYFPGNVNKIRTSIPIANLETCYAYIVSTGQILFAGINTPYYGYTNINNMPTGD